MLEGLLSYSGYATSFFFFLDCGFSEKEMTLRYKESKTRDTFFRAFAFTLSHCNSHV